MKFEISKKEKIVSFLNDGLLANEKFRDLAARRIVLEREMENLERRAERTVKELEEFVELLKPSTNTTGASVLPSGSFQRKSGGKEIKCPTQANDLLKEILLKRSEYNEVVAELNKIT